MFCARVSPRRAMVRAVSGSLFLSLIFLSPVSVRAQTVASDTPAAEAQAQDVRPTGLPKRITWTFNMDAGWGTFGFGNSLYTNPHEPGTPENLSDQWFEGYVKPALSGSKTLSSTSVIYGKISGVGERTYGSVPTTFGTDVSSFQAEDLYIGWRSGKSLKAGENALDVTIGRTQYHLGHGFLIYDGAAEGGSRGGYWTNARKAFQFAAIARFKPEHHNVEVFYLDKDELPENDTGSRTWGANYEYTLGKDEATTTLGVTYMRWMAHAAMRPGRDGLNVINLRAYSTPIATMPDLSFELELASERNGQALTSDAFTLQGAYEFSKVNWKPKLSYRYASFEGDDPSTATNEAFDPLFLGFYDWGTWWQGEIGGEYFLSNSNLTSHQFRAHFTPSKVVSAGVIYYNFKLDQPGSYGPGVTAKPALTEFDAYTDWKVNSNFTVSLVGAFANPGPAVQQFSGRTKNFGYVMVYVGYSY
jgi:hypothetical protein